MVIMVGPPASGKGFFLERGKGLGKGLPESTQGLFKEDHIPDEKLGVEESDNNLRGIQYFESRSHFDRLKKAHKKGKKDFEKALDDMWYKTKDGDVRKLSSFISHDTFDPESHKEFYGKAAKAFYVSMRGWHNDADEINPDTGKIKERFKDEARLQFEEDVKRKVTSQDKDMLIVDSAGEDIDAQDFEGQIKAAKSAGYEVSVIVLDLDKTDTKLANKFRGFVSGKRMVDNEDIENYYAKYEAEIEKIKKAAPHNFLHFKKPPLSHEERKDLKKKMTKTPDGKPTILEDPDSLIRTIDDLEGGLNTKERKKEAEKYQKDLKAWVDGGRKGTEPTKPKRSGVAADLTKNIGKTLFSKDYEIDKSSSFGISLTGVPENPYIKKDKSRPEKSETKKDDSWLEQKVKNPDTGNTVKIKTLKSKPTDSQGHQHYKKLLEERQKKTASRVVMRYLTKSYQKRASTMMQMKKEMGDIKSLVEKELRNREESYPLTVELGRGPVVFVKAEGGDGDTRESRRIRQILEKPLQAYSDRHFEGDLSFKISGFNVGDFLVLEIKVMFPE